MTDDADGRAPDMDDQDGSMEMLAWVLVTLAAALACSAILALARLAQ